MTNDDYPSVNRTSYFDSNMIAFVNNSPYVLSTCTCIVHVIVIDTGTGQS